MQTLLIISFSAFVIAALAWFSTWAFWIHPPEGWLGREVLQLHPVLRSDQIRHSRWFRWLKIATVILGIGTAGLVFAALAQHSRQIGG
jgi:hypothetical protein